MTSPRSSTTGSGHGGGPPGDGNGPFEVADDRAEIEAVEDKLLTEIDRHGYPKSSRFAVKLAFEEAVTNAFQHGHRTLDVPKPVRVAFTVSADEITVTVEDQGPGFDPGTIPDPTLDENLSNPTGRGIMLMRAYMTSVSHNDSGNTVTLVYRRPQSA